jgi:hypothetical protein
MEYNLNSDSIEVIVAYDFDTVKPFLGNGRLRFLEHAVLAFNHPTTDRSAPRLGTAILVTEYAGFKRNFK